MSKNGNDEITLPIFHLEEKFPNAKSIFATAAPAVEEIKEDALVIPDTNVLLIPYDIQPKSLADIKSIYGILIEQNRLFIPAQVAREFVKNRGDKIKNLFNSLNQKQGINLSKTNYRLLEGFEDYDELLKVEDEINSNINAYRKKLKAVLDRIRSWRWNDPVSNLYRELFKPEIIVEVLLSKENLEKDLERRLDNRISPGFKDSGKDDKGIGDVIIWNTILELGQQHNKPIIFITGEEKTDWMLRSSNEALYPNFELIEEYARASDGKSFHITSVRL
jgi:rRNA-processing protein FCF1